ncbi:MAG: hypothetical protein IPK50_18700 [Fibrobacterota bacterium]|nr:hypothetical protein [Fibrobacterota bacterium]QQS04299.1 MAG: hypothetical protein IPK50_18700 [Fibrobacterota bacterium]
MPPRILGLTCLCASLSLAAPDTTAVHEFAGIYPAPSSWLATKIARRESGYPARDVYAAMVDVQPVLHTRLWGGPSGGYVQFQAPTGVYLNKDGSQLDWAGESRLQLEIGPPTGWWMSGGPSLGFIHFSRDWLAGKDGSRTALLYGGAARWAVWGLDEGFVELRGGRSLAGYRIGRFSCGMRWFFSRHVGLQIHGDNFWILGEGASGKQSGTFAGLEFRL